MVIYFGSDHRGFELKQRLLSFAKNMAYESVDLGNTSFDPNDDYAIYAAEVAKKVSADPEGAKGILVCGSGVGVDITANKFDGVRSVLGFNGDQIYSARHDDNVNVLSLSSEFTSPEDAEKFLKVFLLTPFGGDEKYSRRLDEIKNIEHGN